MTHARRSALLLGTLATVACCLTGCGPDERYAVRFDGLYRSDARAAGGSTYWRYLRFTEQGQVLSVSSTEQPIEVAAWLRVPFENLGTWRIEEDVLRFSCKGPNGTVEYEGDVLRDGLQLRVHSRINDSRSERRYAFVEFGEEAPGP